MSNAHCSPEPCCTEQPGTELMGDRALSWLQQLKLKGLATAFALGVAFGSGFVSSLGASGPVALRLAGASGGYDQVELGMTLVEVRSILGSGHELSRSVQRTEFEWQLSDGTPMYGRFEAGELSEKRRY